MSTLDKNKSKKGFTIVEAVLVLAVAALIFMMVFLILPAAQRAVRNNQRKQAMSQLLRAIDNYVADMQGQSPIEDLDQDTIWKNFNFIIGEYLGVGNATDTRNGDCALATNGRTTSLGSITNYQFHIVDKDNSSVCTAFTDPDGMGYGIDIRTKGPAHEESMYFTIELSGINYTDVYSGTNTIGQEGGTQYDMTQYWSNYMVIFPEAYCAGDEGVVKQSTNEPSNIAIAYVLEGGAVACVDNSSSH